VESHISQLRDIIREILEDEKRMSGNRDLSSRAGKGYGVSHPWAERKSTNLGMSAVDEKLIDDGVQVSDLTDAEDSAPVKISKAFKRKINT
jgi:hypothetical protein|tara:strand:- start:434 stop:706 length:273 start_codon:yes stop_codon:yes gene_type:complete